MEQAIYRRGFWHGAIGGLVGSVLIGGLFGLLLSL